MEQAGRTAYETAHVTGLNVSADVAQRTDAKQFDVWSKRAFIGLDKFVFKVVANWLLGPGPQAHPGHGQGDCHHCGKHERGWPEGAAGYSVGRVRLEMAAVVNFEPYSDADKCKNAAYDCAEISPGTDSVHNLRQ